MIEFDKIYVVWRKGVGGRRTAIGEIVKTIEGKHTFKYFPKAIGMQKNDGFTPYTEFQNLQKVYNENVAEIFGQRLTKSDRPDIDSFYKFWEVDVEKIKDKFYLLGKTQGLVATDNFEFLADFKYFKGISFLTEIAGLSITQLSKGTLQIGDVLHYELEPKNEKDKLAVKVFKGNLHLGYIKKYNSKIFHDVPTGELKLTVKAIDQNGILKRVFIRVFN